eukprot:3789962-Rhodomonas_salina.1
MPLCLLHSYTAVRLEDLGNFIPWEYWLGIVFSLLTWTVTTVTLDGSFPNLRMRRLPIMMSATPVLTQLFQSCCRFSVPRHETAVPREDPRDLRVHAVPRRGEKQQSRHHVPGHPAVQPVSVRAAWLRFVCRLLLLQQLPRAQHAGLRILLPGVPAVRHLSPIAQVQRHDRPQKGREVCLPPSSAQPGWRALRPEVGHDDLELHAGQVWEGRQGDGFARRADATGRCRGGGSGN